MRQRVGDLDGNAAAILAVRKRAAAKGAELVMTPEMQLPGYPAEDLVLKPSFVRATMAAADALIEATSRLGLLATYADRAWVLHGDGDQLRVTHHDGRHDGALEGPAEALLLVLMGRTERAAVTTSGDAAVVEAWMGLPGL